MLTRGKRQKRNEKRISATILAAIITLTALIAVPIGAETSGDWGYTVNDDGVIASVNRYYGSETTVTIPSAIDGYSITALTCLTENWNYYGIFYNTSVTSVTIPDSVWKIDRFSFYDNGSALTVYFTGTEEQWNAITIEPGNVSFDDARIIFNYVPEPPVNYGDADANGTIDAFDVIHVAQYILDNTVTLGPQS